MALQKLHFIFSLRLRLSSSLLRTCIRTAHTAHGSNYGKRVELLNNSNRIDNFSTQYYYISFFTSPNLFIYAAIAFSEL